MSAQLAIAVAVQKFADCGPGEWWFVHHPDGFLIECGIQQRAEQIAAEINAGRSPSPDLSLVQATAPLPSTSSPEAGDANQPETATRRLDGFGSVQDGRKMSTNGLSAGVAEQQNDTAHVSVIDETAGETATACKTSAPAMADNGDKDRVAPVGGPTHSPEREPGNPEVSAICNTRVPSGDSRPAARGPLENAAKSPAGDPVRTSPSFRPHCQNRSLCASGTRDHCHSCKRAMEAQAA